MRRPKTEPTLSIYRNPERELMFHGELDACREHGVKISGVPRMEQVRLDGTPWRIVQHNYDADGSCQLWVVGL